MILDTIIELENKFIKKYKKPPAILKLNYMHYCALMKELDESYFLDKFHNMKLQIIESNKIEVE